MDRVTPCLALCEVVSKLFQQAISQNIILKAKSEQGLVL